MTATIPKYTRTADISGHSGNTCPCNRVRIIRAYQSGTTHDSSHPCIRPCGNVYKMVL